MIREGVDFVMERNRFVWDRRYPRSGQTFVCCVGGETALVGLHGRLWQLTGLNACFMHLESLYFYFVWGIYEDNMHKIVLSCRISHYVPRPKRVIAMARPINVHHLLLRLQRWTRRILWYRKVAIPVLMGQHPRLGKDCPLRGLDFEVLARLILPCTRKYI